jgi:hypothetical protein
MAKHNHLTIGPGTIEKAARIFAGFIAAKLPDQRCDEFFSPLAVSNRFRKCDDLA